MAGDNPYARAGITRTSQLPNGGWQCQLYNGPLCVALGEGATEAEAIRNADLQVAYESNPQLAEELGPEHIGPYGRFV